MKCRYYNPAGDPPSLLRAFQCAAAELGCAIDEVVMIDAQGTRMFSHEFDAHNALVNQQKGSEQ